MKKNKHQILTFWNQINIHHSSNLKHKDMKTTFNWGIIGLGGIAEKFAIGLSVVENAQLFAVASRTLENAQSFSKRYPANRVYGSYEELAKDPDVDVVYIATPHPHHFENTMLCLEHGKAVLCEKPFAMNEDQVKMMIDEVDDDI